VLKCTIVRTVGGATISGNGNAKLSNDCMEQPIRQKVVLINIALLITQRLLHYSEKHHPFSSGLQHNHHHHHH
jgi:hypothetical protein